MENLRLLGGKTWLIDRDGHFGRGFGENSVARRPKVPRASENPAQFSPWNIVCETTLHFPVETEQSLLDVNLVTIVQLFNNKEKEPPLE